jgi:hypothetical protein
VVDIAVSARAPLGGALQLGGQLVGLVGCQVLEQRHVHLLLLVEVAAQHRLEPGERPAQLATGRHVVRMGCRQPFELRDACRDQPVLEAHRPGRAAQSAQEPVGRWVDGRLFDRGVGQDAVAQERRHALEAAAELLLIADFELVCQPAQVSEVRAQLRMLGPSQRGRINLPRPPLLGPARCGCANMVARARWRRDHVEQHEPRRPGADAARLASWDGRDRARSQRMRPPLREELADGPR